MVELARGKYKGFNDHHLTEKLKEQESIELSREKVRRILRAEGIGSPKKRRGLKHRSRTESRAAEGMMLQVDGSPHDWLQGRGPPMCLIGAIDDVHEQSHGSLICPDRALMGLLPPVVRNLQAAWSVPVGLYVEDVVINSDMSKSCNSANRDWSQFETSMNQTAKKPRYFSMPQ